MREILFRGKTNKGEWVKGCLISVEGYCCILQDEETADPDEYPYLCNNTGCIDGYATPVIPETVGQYTGLTDKNGKKIFEGDIVMYYEKKGIVTANVSNCGCCHSVYGFSVCDCDGRPESLILIEDSEVIGNIYDNPELLKEGEDNEF